MIIAASAALFVIAAVSLWPMWSERVLPEKDQSNGLVEPTISNWLSEASSRKPVISGRTMFASADQLNQSPDSFRERLMIVSSLTQGIFQQDGRTMIVLGPDENTRIIAMYPAERKDLELGKEITVAGLLSSEGNEIYALALSQGNVKPKQHDIFNLSLASLVVSAGLLMSTGTLVVRQKINRKRSFGSKINDED